MCGIAGYWSADGRPMEEVGRSVDRALAALAHRGPDDSGHWRDDRRQIVLGHRRLAIIDLTDAGHQPMSPWYEPRISVVFNGEIYNHVELRQRLETKGYEFRSRSDTEVLLAAYHHWGVECLTEFRGMFALGLWDGRDDQLLLARDRAGKKPLYYSANSRRLVFASELNAIRTMRPREEQQIDTDALDGYLSFGHVVGERTIYRNVHELPPGSYAFCRRPTEVAPRRYWRLNLTCDQSISNEDAVDETDRILQEAVRLRMRSDVPVGVFLSGGIDSGLVTALAAAATDQPIRTICIGLDDERFDERPLARLVAERYATDHREIVIRPDVRTELPAIARQYGEPFADASAIPSYFVSRAAAAQCKVVLNGDGGDELFCGYRRHAAARMLGIIERQPLGSLGSLAARYLAAILPIPQRHRSRYALAYRLMRGLAVQGADRILALSTDGLRTFEKNRLYSSSSGALRLDRLVEDLGIAGNRDPLLELHAYDFSQALPDGLLVKMDIASMAHSIEARSPLLDQELVAWAFRIPAELKLAGSQTKVILRELARRYLPTEIVEAPKRGFEVPVADWLDGELREMRDDMILRRSGLVASLFRRDRLEDLLARRRQFRMTPGRWAQIVWTLLMLAMWDEQCWSAASCADSRGSSAAA